MLCLRILPGAFTDAPGNILRHRRLETLANADRLGNNRSVSIHIPRESSICAACGHMREIVSGKGTRFLLCRLSETDGRYPKYPPQPVIRCHGYKGRAEAGEGPEHSRVS